MADRDYFYLCCNCGSISAFSRWTLLQRDLDTDELRLSRDGESDPICVCPDCGWHHVDDDSNPGIEDGTEAELETVRRERYFNDPIWADRWIEDWAERLAKARANLMERWLSPPGEVPDEGDVVYLCPECFQPSAAGPSAPDEEDRRCECANRPGSKASYLVPFKRVEETRPVA